MSKWLAFLAERMPAALDSTRAVGRGLRSRQSAAILVVSEAATGWQEEVSD
jgi:uncharacterized Ntn-hydrolase superfamily protein